MVWVGYGQKEWHIFRGRVNNWPIFESSKEFEKKNSAWVDLNKRSHENEQREVASLTLYQCHRQIIQGMPETVVFLSQFSELLHYPPTPPLFHPTTHRSELRSEFRPDGMFSALVAVQPFKLGKEAFIGDQTWCLGLGQWGSIWPILAVWRLQIMRMFEIQEISFHIWNGLWCCRI